MVMMQPAFLIKDVRLLPIAVTLVAMLGVHANAARCPQPCLSGVCDDVTGSCVIEGSGLDIPPEVTRVGCPRGFYSDDCTNVCPANCINSTCSQDTGQCTQGCKAGYSGTDCTSDCPEGFHGESCAQSCPENCENSTCNSQSGVCSNGCVDGYWGSDCSLGIQLSRNSPEEKRAFYSHLSAEGKSVLLYLLTSRYDHALARAQFEIERAVQDRNEIRHILQGR